MKKFYTLLSVLISFLLYYPASADWPCRVDSSTPICTKPGNQWNVHLTVDGVSGAILVWQDRRGGSEDKIYYQRVNGAGNVVWDSGGVPLALSGGYQYYPQIISDGNGGAFIAWQDNRYGVDYDIFIQRVSASGIPLWSTNGTLVCNAVAHQYNPQLVTDGAGGVIVAWQDKRNGNFDIFAQRYDALGQPQWTNNGQQVCLLGGDQIDPRLVSDGQGGAIVSWTDYRAGTGFTDVYAQRMLSNGQQAWTVNGVPVCLATNTQWNIRSVSDGNGGVIIVWQDRRTGTYDNIYAQRLTSVGAALWAENGIPLGAVVGMQYYPQVVSDNNGGAVAVWQDNRRGSDYDILGQRVSASGQLLWSPSGQSICGALGHQYNPQVVQQGKFIIATWQDRRASSYDIYSQRVDLSGAAQWDADGVPVSVVPQDQFSPQLASDSTGGAIIAWPDYHLGVSSTDIYAHRIGSNGKPAGGCYRSFSQFGFSMKGVKIFNRYTGVRLMPNEGNVRDTIFRRGIFSQGVLLGIERLDEPRLYAWEYFTRSTFVRRALPQNGLSKPFDRNVNSILRGPLRNPNVFRYNNRLAGELLTLKMNIAASDVGISESHFGEIIFLDTSNLKNPLNNKSLRDVVAFIDTAMTYWRSNIADPNFYPLLGFWLGKINNAFAGPIDTISTNPLRLRNTTALSSVPYFITNLEPPPFIPSYQPSVSDEQLPNKMQLLQNYPNPFNPVTSIEFVLPVPATVTLKLYNTLGQEIATLLDHVPYDEGRDAIDFNASGLSSGVYFYTLVTANLEDGILRTNTKKMILLK